MLIFSGHSAFNVTERSSQKKESTLSCCIKVQLIQYEFKGSHVRISKLYISVPEDDLISANSVDSDRMWYSMWVDTIVPICGFPIKMSESCVNLHM